MVERRKPEGPEPEPEENYQTARNISFMERWKMLQEEKKQGKVKPGIKGKVFMRLVYLFQIPSEVAVFMYYILPHFLADCDPMTLYYAKALTIYLGLVLTANWLAVILYDPSYLRTKDQPLLPVSNNNSEGNEYFVSKIQDATANGVGQHSVFDIGESDGLPWHFCDKCAMHVPFRTHHCSVCNKCIVKKDHHCFMLGCCIGYKNQRYFIVFCLYIIIFGFVGSFLTIKYIAQNTWEDMFWYDLIVPVPIFRWMFGDLQGLHCLLVVQIYIELLFGLMCLGFFCQQTLIIYRGITFYEYKKSLSVRNNSSPSKNARSVFGDFWALNFLFPMTLIFKQPGDGTAWEGLELDGRKNSSKGS